ncbi:50S ribosomal protein L24 [Enemella evansiae]|uniref:Large ribosomal subunit protein uL24 n=1 Tax=Enemella evansiae TaxID=2016499 RepID=A0A255GBZ5_9ACTN|nr:50S ribosomal protein L24 [Enemella evansiae]PFG68488.1 large subunit ribosomal protein L24 [Propionibacteriaceae bacterium ES.041]OYN95477.1 50S ribosomal protein L24 [Enemella evansiae]OYO01670.1 50S ribosomal protein L24 [Enemella evansiae]OYO03585.1 50S ribosomal protein L24 [Enemella evansiae]OYO10008.1 50S ribosomal protein L24 [Enemella evansiae]
MSNTLHVKKGDRVKVISGKDRGTVGEILAVDVERNRVIVQGVNIVKRHVRETPTATGKTEGGIISREAPIHASNVQLVVKDGGKEVVTRVGFKREEVTKRRPDGSEYKAFRSVRIARRTGEEI